jgi:hypothetical protein
VATNTDKTMPSDASIYSMIRQPQAAPDPIAQYGNVLQLKTLMGQQGLQDLQRKELERGIADEGRIRDLYAAGKKPTVEEVSAISPKRGMEYGKVLMEEKKAQAGIDKDRAETFLKYSTYMRDKLATVNDQAGYNAWIEEGARLFGPDVARTSPQQFSPEVKTLLLQKADDLIVPLAKKLELQVQVRGQDLTDKRTREEGAANRSVQIRGQNLTDQRARDAAEQGKWVNDLDRGIQVNTATGESRPITAGGVPLGGRDKPLTEAQGNATGFGIRATEAQNILQQLEDGGTFGKGAGVVQGVRESLDRVPVIGTAAANVASAAGNMVLPEAQQRYDQAKGDFIRAVLRKESGATITAEETASATRQYFPVMGDSPEVIEQKRKNRITAIKSLGVQAGSGADKLPKLNAPNPKPKGVDVTKMSDDELRRELGL